MSTSEPQLQSAPETETDEDRVQRHLQANPGFFERHPDLLAEMRVPHESGAAVSLVQRQIEVLREQNRQLRERMDHLINVARENDRLHERLHRLNMALITCEDLDDLLATLHETLCTGFAADCSAVRLIVPPGHAEVGRRECVTAADAEMRTHFGDLLDSGRPLCGRLRESQLIYLFGDQAGDIQSAVLVPLGEGQVCGLIAVGSADAHRFRSGMGTVFLSHMGELIGRLAAPHLT